MKNKNANRSSLALRGGSYSMLITVLVLAILIVANIFVSALPANFTNLDMSANKLYSITSNTKAVVHNLQQDITIYWIVQAGEEDEVLENMLDKYDGLSSHIQVVRKNPDVYPTFAAQYTSEDVPNNSLIVESADRHLYISYNDLYQTELDYESYTYSSTSFNGEREITSAIDYAVTDDLPLIYCLSGHGEAEMPSSFSQAISEENYLRAPLTLLSEDSIPKDADAVLIHAPQTDISESERTMLAQYIQQGGKLMVVSGPVEGGELKNLNSLLTDYGVTFVPGIVMEGNRDNYSLDYPYALMPNMYSDDITDSLIDANYHPILPLAQGMVENNSEAVSVLLTTTSLAYNKADGFGLTSYEKEEGDMAGPFAVAVRAEDASGGQIIWFSSESFLDDMNNNYSSGANVNLAMNALSSLIGDYDALSIRSKPMQYNYLSISASTATMLKALMIGVFPIAYLAIGGFVIITKRSKRYEKK